MKLLLLSLFALSGCMADVSSTNKPTQASTFEEVAHDTDAKLNHASSVPPASILAASPDGNLHLYDCSTGELLDSELAHAVDVYAPPNQTNTAFFSEWSEDGGGALVTLSLQHQQIQRVESIPLSSDNVRLIHAPEPMVGLAIQEGTVLFDGGEGRATFGVSSHWQDPSTPSLSVWLLQQRAPHPRLANYQWDASMRKVSDSTVDALAFACPPKLVRGGDELLIVGGFERALVVLDQTGQVRHWAAQALAEGACVEDALSVSAEQIAVITSPDARVHVLSTQEATSQHLTLASKLSHDSQPQRRLAFDVNRHYLWIALADGLEVRELDHGNWVEAGIKPTGRAESLVVIP